MSSSIQEMLRQRQEALKSAQAAGAIPGKATSETSAGAGLSTIAVGLQGSQESSGLLMPSVQAVIASEPDEDKAATALGVFAAAQIYEEGRYLG